MPSGGDFPCHDGALEAAFRGWADAPAGPAAGLAPGEDYKDGDLEAAFKAGAAWAAGRGVAGLPVIVPVCDRCHMPAILGQDGRYRHAEAADAAFCGLVMGGRDP